MRELRESIEKEKDAISIGYFAAALHVEFIGRIVTFTDQLDEALDYRLFLEDHPLQENLRRANSALRIYKTLTDMLCEGFRACFCASVGWRSSQLKPWESGRQMTLSERSYLIASSRSRLYYQEKVRGNAKHKICSRLAALHSGFGFRNRVSENNSL